MYVLSSETQVKCQAMISFNQNSPLTAGGVRTDICPAGRTAYHCKVPCFEHSFRNLETIKKLKATKKDVTLLINSHVVTHKSLILAVQIDFMKRPTIHLNHYHGS